MDSVPNASRGSTSILRGSASTGGVRKSLMGRGFTDLEKDSSHKKKRGRIKEKKGQRHRSLKKKNALLQVIPSGAEGRKQA